MRGAPHRRGLRRHRVHRSARICAAGHGGQVLLSQTSRELLAEEPLEDVDLRDLGPHRLKDLTRPERIFQLLAAGLEQRFPALDTLEARPTNLPVQPTPLIGRARATGRSASGFAPDEMRLLTLTGPGGSGKTRLALQVAADALGDFPSGVFFVGLPLSPIPTTSFPRSRDARHQRIGRSFDRPRHSKTTSVTASSCSCSTTSSTWSRPRRPLGNCSPGCTGLKVLVDEPRASPSVRRAGVSRAAAHSPRPAGQTRCSFA